jgi:cell volume regulation protein A
MLPSGGRPGRNFRKNELHVTLAALPAVEDRLFLVGGVLLLSVVGAVVARRLSVPVLVLFLGLGMLLGSDGPGGIYFDNADLTRTIGVIGLIAILFEGGLTSEWRDLRRVMLPAFLLSTVGVLVTAFVVGAAARSLFDLSWPASLLLGAVVGSTDAAAVFATLRVTNLRRRIASLLGAESGINDPTAVALTLGLIAWLSRPEYGVGDVVLLLVRQLGLGAVIGVALGLVAARLLPRLPSDLAPFAPVASVAAAALAYGVAEEAGASGFLSVYVVGVFIGNTPMPLRRAIVTFHEGLAFLAQVALFVVLGLLVFPSDLASVALSAIAVTLVLTFVARPLAVLLSTPFQGFGVRERIFLSWAGLRGAVPIVLATFALSDNVAESDTIFNAVFFVVLLSALLQGLTLEPLARRLRLATEPRPYYDPPLEIGSVHELGADVIEFAAQPADAVVGTRIRYLGLPPGAIVMLIVRGGLGIAPRGNTVIEPDDRLSLLVTDDCRDEIEELLELWERGPMPQPVPTA